MQGRPLGISLLYFTLLVAPWQSIVAQSLEPPYYNFTTNDGLPSSECYEIIEDRQGYMWISTDNGVCRYDGHYFEHFGPEQGLSDRTILFMHEDHRGWIWMNSFDGNFFIHRGDSIVPFPYNYIIQNIRKEFDFVHDFFVDKQGTLHLSLSGMGILTIDSQGKPTFFWRNRIEKFRVLGIYDHPDGFLQLTKISPTGIKTPQNLFYLARPQSVEPLDSFIIQHINKGYISAKGLFYAFPFDDGYLLQSRRTLSIISHDSEVLSNRSFTYGAINSFAQLSNDNVLLGFFEKKGLQIYENMNALRNGEQPLFLLANHTISHITEDRRGGIWIASIENGIYYYPSFQQQFLQLDLGTDEIGALAADATQDFSLYLGTRLGKVVHIDESKTARQLPPLTGNFDLVNLQYVPENQSLIVGNPVQVFQSRRWKTLMANVNEATQSQVVVNKLIPSHSQKSLLGFTKHGAFTELLVDGKQITNRRLFFLEKDIYLTSALQTTETEFLLGTRSGLFVAHLNKEKESVLKDSLLTGNSISSLLQLPDKSILVGVRNNGLFHLKRQQKGWQLQDSLMHGQAIRLLKLAPDTSIWVATSANGLYKLGYRDSLFHLGQLSTSNGLRSNEIIDLTFTQEEVWVASKKELISHPINLAEIDTQRLVRFTSMIVDGTPVQHGRPLEMQYQSQCQIGFSAFDFASIRKTRYRYRLEQENSWIETTEPELNLSNLNAGNYQLEVQFLVSNSRWSKSAVLPLLVSPPFWQTGWFFLLCLAAGLLIVYAFFRRRLRYLSREKERLALQEEVNRLKQQAYRAQMNPHFIFNCLSTIQGMIIGDEIDKDQAVRMLASFSQLIRFALDASRQDKVSLRDEIDLLKRYLLLEQQRFDYSFQFSIEVDPELDLDWVELPPLLVQAYAENAVLHGMENKDGDGLIQVKYLAHKDRLKIIIEDNGPGITATKAIKKQHKSKLRHRSAGMTITQERLKIINSPSYKVDIQEPLDTNGAVQGTKITIII